LLDAQVVARGVGVVELHAPGLALRAAAELERPRLVLELLALLPARDGDVDHRGKPRAWDYTAAPRGQGHYPPRAAAVPGAALSPDAGPGWRRSARPPKSPPAVRCRPAAPGRHAATAPCRRCRPAGCRSTRSWRTPSGRTSPAAAPAG